MVAGRDWNGIIERLHGAQRLRVWSVIITVFGDAIVPRGGRVALSHQAVESAAADAARAASISRTQGQAASNAETAAAASLSSQNLRCVSTSVSIDTAGFASPVGTPASVGATVTCQVDLAGLLPGLPGSMTISATMRSPLDTYRER